MVELSELPCLLSFFFPLSLCLSSDSFPLLLFNPLFDMKKGKILELIITQKDLYKTV